MLTNISAWAVLTLVAFIAPPLASPTDRSPEPVMDVIQTVEDSNLQEIVVVPSTAVINFDKVQVLSVAAPKPEPVPEPAPEPVPAPAPEPEAVTASTPTEPTTAKTAKKATTGATQAATPEVKAVAASPGSAQAEAASQMQAYGWGADELTCLTSLWEKESNWKSTAENPSSGAYGIPQSLPGTKMASAGADWKTNPATQIKWGLGYIKDRYKTPCGAWGHSVQVGWY